MFGNSSEDDDVIQMAGETVPNASYILGLLRQLSSEQLEALYKQLGIKRHEELIEWIPELANENHPRSYEKVCNA